MLQSTNLFVETKLLPALLSLWTAFDNEILVYNT